MTSPAARHRQAVMARQAEEAAATVERARPADPISAPSPPFGLPPLAERAEGRPEASAAAVYRQQTLARIAAEQAQPGAAAVRPTDGPAATEYELLLAKLGADLARLKDIQSVEGKIELKRDLVSGYDVHVNATLDAAAETMTALQDEIVATMLIWRLDIGDYGEALRLADHVLAFGLAMPQHIRRKPATLIAEEIAEPAIMAAQVGTPFDHAVIDRTIALTANEDMPDEVRAKLYKARGRLLMRIADAHAGGDAATAPAGAAQAARRDALEALRRALTLNSSCGVKKDIERLAVAVGKDAPASPDAPQE